MSACVCPRVLCCVHETVQYLYFSVGDYLSVGMSEDMCPAHSERHVEILLLMRSDYCQL